MRYAIVLELLEWAAKSDYAREFLDYLISRARDWAEDDGKEDWNDTAVDILEAVADFLYDKYNEED